MTDRVPFARRRCHLAAPALVAAAVAAVVACSDYKTGPNTPVALSFDALPFPAIVIGDSLRDSTGAVAPLRASAYNADGDRIADAPIRWFVVTRDTLARPTADTLALAVDSVTGLAFAPRPADSILYARRRSLSVTVLPQVSGLPGPQRQVPLTLRPHLLVGPDSQPVEASLSCLDTTFLGRSTTVTARVGHDSSADSLSPTPATASLPVRSWPVRFTLVHHGVVVADSSRALRLLTEVGRRASTDTTDESGSVSRLVWFNADSVPGFAVLKDANQAADTSRHARDTVVVRIATRFRGAALAAVHDSILVPIAITRFGAACK